MIFGGFLGYRYADYMYQSNASKKIYIPSVPAEVTPVKSAAPVASQSAAAYIETPPLVISPSPVHPPPIVGEIPASNPKYMTPETFASCVLLSAKVHSVPAAVLIGIMRVEGGHIGDQQGPLEDGSYKLGPMQISSNLMPEIAQGWKVSSAAAYALVRDDGCINVDVAAWLLRKKTDEANSVEGGIKLFHSESIYEGTRYAEEVVAVMRKFDLVKDDKSH